MDNKDKRKIKYALVVGTAFIFLASCPGNKKYHPSYEILSDNVAFARYSNGYVYIGNENFLKHVNANDNDVLVLDERAENNNIKIIDSYKIDNKECQNEILCIIEEYEKKYPTMWDRSLESMRTEWQVHNFFYGFHIRKDSTVDVDFENNEEELYNIKILRKTFY